MAGRTAFNESLKNAFEAATEGMVVSGVHSVWAPGVQDDGALARGEAEGLGTELRAAYPEISDDEMDRLVQFGTAVGSISLRRLFEPFKSDAIVVTYAEGSGQDHTDAVRRVANGMNVNQANIVG